MSRFRTLFGVFCLSTVVWFGVAQGGLALYKAFAAPVDLSTTAAVR